MKKTRSSTKAKSIKTHTTQAHSSSVPTDSAAEKPRRAKRSASDQRNAFINAALDRYAIPFVRQVEAKLISWQATL